MHQASSTESIRALVQSGRVHSRIYTDQAIFELEVERIFHSTWIYVGHESEVPNIGDFQTRKIGRTPVIMVRGRDNQVRVLVNRCRHRGAQVVETESGNTKMLRCWYHGWAYDLTGALAEVTEPGGYGPDFKREEMGLTPVPRFDSYRGFVFGSLKSAVEPLRTFLGPAAEAMDVMIDASPTGELIVDGGVNKTEYLGNWKLIGQDGYHPNYTHASVVSAWERNADAGIGAMHRDDPYTDQAATLTRDLGHGHAMLDFRQQRVQYYSKQVAFLSKIPGGAEYVQKMHETYGKERAEFLVSMAGDPHVGIYPNLQLTNNQVRIITPIGPGVTQVDMAFARFGGVSDEINTVRVRQHESFYGPAGSGSPDDSEIFERVQRGMAAEVNPWIEISRGMHREYVDAKDGTIVGKITDETTQRGQMRQWLKLMTQSD